MTDKFEGTFKGVNLFQFEAPSQRLIPEAEAKPEKIRIIYDKNVP
jgi:hypothetical protein